MAMPSDSIISTSTEVFDRHGQPQLETKMSVFCDVLDAYGQPLMSDEVAADGTNERCESD